MFPLEDLSSPKVLRKSCFAKSLHEVAEAYHTVHLSDWLVSLCCHRIVGHWFRRDTCGKKELENGTINWPDWGGDGSIYSVLVADCIGLNQAKCVLVATTVAEAKQTVSLVQIILAYTK